MVNGSPVSGGTSQFLQRSHGRWRGRTNRHGEGQRGRQQRRLLSPVTVTIRPLTPPTIQFAYLALDGSLRNQGHSRRHGNGSACGGPVTIRYSGEGVTGNVFDSTALSFDQSNRLQQQSKTVTITATATDPKNQTATRRRVTVTLTAQARRLDDIVFPDNSSRVNNCAKRLLLEELTPMLRNDPDAKVILIGHRDSSEKGKAASKLDEARVLNAAAVLSAGKGICPSLDLSRIMVNWVGTDQSRRNPSGSLRLFDQREGKGRPGREGIGQARAVPARRNLDRSGRRGYARGPERLKDAPVKEIQAKGCPK